MSASAWAPVEESAGQWTPVEEQGLGMGGASLTNAGAVPNARLRNLPNPAAGETSNIGALYHGAKMGATLASIPASASLTIPSAARMLVGGTVGTVAGQQLSKAVGAGQFGQEVSGDIGGLLGAGLTEGAYNAAKSRLQSVYNALPKAVQDELKTQALGALSPRAKHFLGFAKALRAEYAPVPEATPPEVAQPAPAAPLEGPNLWRAQRQALGEMPVAKAPGQAGSMVQSVTKPATSNLGDLSNFPTASSRAASDAAFARNFPSERYEQGVDFSTLEKPLDTEPFAKATEQAKRELGPNASTKDVINRRNEIIGDLPQTRDIGQRSRMANPEPTRAEVKGAQAKTGQLGDLLDQSLGVKRPIPGVKLKNQSAAQAAAENAIPEGHTPVESSALRSYKYDPSAREFTAATKGGDTQYVYGDVSPEGAEKFEKADSKGKAWQDIRNEGTLVAKIVNGKRIPIKPARPSASTGDLSDLLK